jgi:hypothetical protein
MRFLMIRMADAKTEAGLLPTESMLAAMAKYAERMASAGVILGGEGLQPSSKGARIKFTQGKPTVTDGPFTESKELIAGYFMIQVESLAEAIEWAKRWPAFETDAGVELELRQIYEAEDFGPEFTPELRENEERMRRELAGKQ